MKRLFSAVLGALCLSVTAVQAQPAAAPPPVEAFAAFPAVDHVAISPDGQKLAFVIANAAGARGLAIRTLDGQDLGGFTLGDTKVRDVSWADDDHVVITSSRYTQLRNFLNSGEFFNAQSYNINTRHVVLLLRDISSAGGGQTGSRRVRATGDFNVVMGPPFQREIDGRIRTFAISLTRDFSMGVFEVDLDTGMGVLRPEASGIMGADGNAVAKSDWDKDTGRWRVSAKAPVGWREIWSRDGFMIDTPSLLGFGRTEGAILISVPEAQEDAIYEVALASGEARRLDLGELREASAIHHPWSGRLLGFQSIAGDDYKYMFVDPQAAAVWRSLGEAYPEEHVRIVSFTPDFKKVVIRTESAINAGGFSLIDMEAGTAVSLGSQRPGLRGWSLAETRYIDYEAGDGRTIPAYLTLPSGREARDLPLVVMPHGGPAARDMPGYDDWTQVIASRGYAVLRPQFRGSTGFGTAHLEAGYGQWGRLMQSDLTDGVRALAADGMIDPKRVCIFGWSYGGYAAMAGATIDAGTYRCAIAGAGVSDLPRMLSWEKEQTGGRDSPTVRYWKRFMGAERINDNSIADVSPARLADRVEGPVLLIHGRDDSVVPYEQSAIFEQALRRAGKDVQMVTLDGEDHWLSRASGRIAVSRAVVDFLQAHNPAD